MQPAELLSEQAAQGKGGCHPLTPLTSALIATAAAVQADTTGGVSRCYWQAHWF